MNQASALSSQIVITTEKIYAISTERIDFIYFPQHGLKIIGQFSISKTCYQVTIVYPKLFLARFESQHQNEFFLKTNSTKCITNENSICTSLVELFQSMIEHNYKGVFESIYVESLALQILLYSHIVNEEKENTICYACKFLNTPSEKQKIMQARVLTMIHLSNPLSIPALARAVHINECYLKKGFKEMFGTSIYDFVQQERIKKAKLLMKSNSVSITNIAIELGFSNTSNFTNSFKKSTGHTPSEWIRNQQGIIA